LKQKQEKRDKLETSATSNLTYDASQAASASQALNKKLESKKENDTNRSLEILIENFDISFGNR
jgi:hypothetical protein